MCDYNERCERKSGHGGMCGWDGHPCKAVKLDGSYCNGDHYTSNHDLWASKGAKILALSHAIKDFMKKGNTASKAVVHAQEALGITLPKHQEKFIIGALEAEVDRLKTIQLTPVPDRELEDLLDKGRNN